MRRVRAKIVVAGLVQGVGFRPAIYRLATSLGLAGHVRNVGGSEVEIVVEGPAESVAEFQKALLTRLPPPAEIEELRAEYGSPEGIKGFTILPSGKRRILRSQIPPDIGICEHCLREVLDPRDRRYRYALNSCAWCGPRFSMMYTIPWDRENTSMRDFPMCEHCLREYRDPMNERRFHAQGISCPICGPKIRLYGRGWELIDSKDPVAEAAKLVNEGYIVAVKGVGGYHLAALAIDDEVVLKLRRRKRRPTKPFAVMALDLDTASKAVIIGPEEASLLTSPQKPILLLMKRDDTPISKYVSPGMRKEGIFLPYTALHYLLLKDVEGGMAIMTSGNKRGHPMCKDERCAREHLGEIADYFLVHERKIVNRVDDSVMRFTDGRSVMLRRGRGYAPRWIRVKHLSGPEVVAGGADIHNVGAVAFEDKVVLTQYIGDLTEVSVASELRHYLNFFMSVYGIEEPLYVRDLHPGYVSSQVIEGMAAGKGGGTLKIQHHHAHILSTIADSGLDPSEEYVGVAIDGVGYGDDGEVWGCEVMVVKGARYERVSHMEYIGGVGDIDAYYPVRVLVSILSKVMGVEEIISTLKARGLIASLKGGEAEVRAVYRVVTKSPKIRYSSTGRLLDAISSLLGISTYRDFEGEPAIMLEERAVSGKPIESVASAKVFDPPLIRPANLVLAVLEAISEGHRIDDIAYSALWAFGKGLAEAVKWVMKGRRASNHVPVGGGAAVNDVIIRSMRAGLEEAGLKYVLPSRVPPNDGGIALGQVIAAWLYED